MNTKSIPSKLIQVGAISCSPRVGQSNARRFVAFSAALICLMPFPLTAKDHDQGKHEKKEGKGGQQKVGKGDPHQKDFANQGGNGHNQSPNYSRALNSIPTAQQAIRSSNRGSYSPLSQTRTQYAAPQGTRENRYGGNWVPGNTHSDWGNSGEHYWNHRNYRWYDGGWLIISTGSANPGYASGYDRGYSRSSVSRDVQRRLATQGYYHGSFDGDIGPQSRQAIANYQGDNGLRVTGRIDDRLLVSLGLE
ncbi:MAG: peptidoglycan-binding domain-containing protein [Chthoniobacteraceae bacterium]